MTVKERVIEQLEELDETELLEVEKDLQSRATQARIKRQLEELRFLDELAAPNERRKQGGI